MDERAKRKKIYYVPGMISLLVLSSYFFYQVKTKFGVPNLKAMQLSMRPYITDSLQYAYRVKIPNRKYHKVYLTGCRDENKIAKTQLIARRMKNENDTVHGVKFIFTANATYQTFVTALDMCNIENMRVYDIVEDSLFIFMVTPDFREGKIQEFHAL